MSKIERLIDVEVLQYYANAEERHEKVNMTVMGNRLPFTKKEVRESALALKEAGFLYGARGLMLTDEGRDALKAVRPPETRPAEPEALTELAPVGPPKDTRVSLSDALAAEYMVNPDQLFRVISRNIISVRAGDPAPTNEEVMLVMSICQTYGLNPFLRHIHAFRSKGKLQTPVGYDGWVHIANTNPGFKGVQYEYPDPDTMVDRFNKKCFPWVKATAYVEGRAPTVVIVFLDEWAQGDNWFAHPNHRLRLKAYTSCIREALGVALPDDIDAEHIMMADALLADKPKEATVGIMDEMKLAMTTSGFSPPDISVMPWIEPDVSSPVHPAFDTPPIPEEEGDRSE